MSGLLVKSTLIMRENLEELNDAGPGRDPGAARRRRAHAHLRRARPARGLRRSPLLRQGRVRGPPHDGPAHGGQEDRRRSTPTSAAPSAGAILPPRKSEMEAERVGHRRGGALRRRRRRRDLHAAVPRLARRQGHLARRHRRRTSTRPRCSATSGSSVPTSRCSENDAEFKERIRADAARASSTRRRPRAGSCPRSIWGYFPVNADGNDLVVWTDDDRRNERLRFTFPRQRSDRHLCIADFFRRVESGDADYAAFHVVTVGERASRARAGAVRRRPVPGVPAHATGCRSR